MRPPKWPKCTVCGSELEHTPEGWKCPVDGLYFNVERGEAGHPMWLKTEGIKAVQPTPAPPQQNVPMSSDRAVFRARMDKSGRIVIPALDREALGLEVGGMVQVVLRKVERRS